MMPSIPLRELAAARWAQVRVERPEVEPALALHQGLITTQIDLLDDPGVIEAAQSHPPDMGQTMERLAAGRRAIDAAPEAAEAAFIAMGDIAQLLTAQGAGEAAMKIGAALTGTASRIAFDASCLRDVDAMRALARQHGLNLQVLWLIAEVASAPVMHLRQRLVLEQSGEAVRDATADWQRGTCPACGAWPVFAEFFYGERLPRCSYCASTWPVSPGTCKYCGESGEAFRTIVPDRERPGRRLELCRACGGYLKTLDVGRPTPFPLLAVEDFATNDLDRAAQHHGLGASRAWTRSSDDGTDDPSPRM